MDGEKLEFDDDEGDQSMISFTQEEGDETDGVINEILSRSREGGEGGSIFESWFATPPPDSQDSLSGVGRGL